MSAPNCTFLRITADILLDSGSSLVPVTGSCCREGALQGLVTQRANMAYKVQWIFLLVTSLCNADMILATR